MKDEMKRQNNLLLDNSIQIADLALATSLVIFGFEVKTIKRVSYRKAVFIFQQRPGLEKTIQDFWSESLKVEPNKFMSEFSSVQLKL